ncbi:MAG: exo-alpha-sialidase [Phycisphaeraceae bacterium]|nr:exo-alpha-sialidase [Phycisphaeraceae bacterium]
MLLAWTVQAQTTMLNGVEVPGVVVAHSPKSTGTFIGSPSIIILPNGDYLASHDKKGSAYVYRSTDRGVTWEQISMVPHAVWSNMFVHNGDVYMIGTTKGNGQIYIRRSTDNGQTWTDPVDENTGLLTAEDGYHTGPMPVVEHNGRIWRAFEHAIPDTDWGHRFKAMAISAPSDSDLLKRSNWKFTNELGRDPSWLNGGFHGWLEGNIVITPDDKLVDMLRTDHPPYGDTASIINIDETTHTMSFDPATGFVEFPGGGKKFVIHYDPKSQQYISLSNWIPQDYRKNQETVEQFLASQPPEMLSPPKRGKLLTDNGYFNFERTRNTLALVTSPDLIHWEVRYIVIQGSDVAHHGFQYVDWKFDGDDIIALSRTAYDDGVGGADNQHNSNLITFHRIENYLDYRDRVPNPVK